MPLGFIYRSTLSHKFITFKRSLICIVTLLVMVSCSPPTKTFTNTELSKDKHFYKSLPLAAKPNKNFKFGNFFSEHGYTLRYGSSLVSLPKGTIVIAPGQSEFIESYFELINDFNKRNYNVWIMDWHGQGGSEHSMSDHTRAKTNFQIDQDDLKKFFSSIVVYNHKALPVVVAHSMGAHILLSALSSDMIAIDRAVLSSPMVTVKTGLFPHGLSSFVAGFASTIGLGWWYAPGNDEWIDSSNYLSTDNENTSDPMRSLLKQEWRRHKQHTRKSYGVTLEWFNNYSKSRGKILNSSFLTKTKTKILMTVAEIDALVIPADSLKLCRTIINCRSILYKGARHELYLERNNIREKWLDHIFKWLDGKI